MNICKHKQLSDWETESFDDNCEGMQVRRCKDCGEVVRKERFLQTAQKTASHRRKSNLAFVLNAKVADIMANFQ